MNKDKDIKPYNDKGEKHGLWVEYLGGELWYKCYYVNNKENGYEEYYYHNEVELAFHL